MKGPLFERLVERREISLQPNESLDDLETMYSLFIAAMGKDQESVTEEEERFALISLCEIHWPGKPPEYRDTILRVRMSFQGIAEDPSMQRNFLLLMTSILFTAQPLTVSTLQKAASILQGRLGLFGRLGQHM